MSLAVLFESTLDTLSTTERKSVIIPVIKRLSFAVAFKFRFIVKKENIDCELAN